MNNYWDNGMTRQKLGGWCTYTCYHGKSISRDKNIRTQSWSDRKVWIVPQELFRNPICYISGISRSVISGKNIENLFFWSLMTSYKTDNLWRHGILKFTAVNIALHDTNHVTSSVWDITWWKSLHPKNGNWASVIFGKKIQKTFVRWTYTDRCVDSYQSIRNQFLIIVKNLF